MKNLLAADSSAAGDPRGPYRKVRGGKVLPGAAIALCALVVGAGVADASASPARRHDASGAGAAHPAAASAGKPVMGGTLQAGLPADPDHLDPGLGYTNESWEIEEATGDGLLAYRRTSGVAGAQIVPDLATAMPKVSDHGLTYTFHMRTNVKFAPPVNRDVEPTDIKFSIERLFRINSGGVGFYTGIVGAAQYAKTRKGGISGIVANDKRHTIVFHLTKPDGTFLNYVSVPFAFALPVGTPSTDISAKTKYLVGTGPYMVSSYVPQSHITLVRNPNFHQWSPNIPGGYLNKIQIQIGVTPDQAVTETADGQLNWYMEAVAPDRLAQIKAQYPSRLHTYQPEQVNYFTLNMRKPPFNNVLVRQALNYATDGSALVKLAGGQGKATQSLIPPGIAGYVAKPYYPYNLAKAKKLVARSHTKGAAVTVWAPDTDPAPQQAEYMASVLNSLGYKATVKTLNAGVYYDTMSNEKTDPQISWNYWSEDFPDAEDFINVQFNGQNITAQANNDQANLNVPAINHAINVARKMPIGAARAAAWVKINTEISEKYAPLAVFMVPTLPKFVSANLHGLVFNGTYFELLPSMWLSK